MSKNLADLEVWKKGRMFRNNISNLVNTFPSHEKYRLIDQMVRASRSITANVAEGHGRFHFQENIQYCRQARGSLVECYDHLTVALDENYITEPVFEEFVRKYEELAKMLNGYVSYLKTRKSNA